MRGFIIIAFACLINSHKEEQKKMTIPESYDLSYRIGNWPQAFLPFILVSNCNMFNSSGSPLKHTLLNFFKKQFNLILNSFIIVYMTCPRDVYMMTQKFNERNHLKEKLNTGLRKKQFVSRMRLLGNKEELMKWRWGVKFLPPY